MIITKTFYLFQNIVWLCNGTRSLIKRNYLKYAYKGSVQMLNILGRHKFCTLLQPSGANDFVTSHKEFVDPEYVLQDHVTLYNITHQEAIFVETDVGIAVTESQYGAFIKLAQFNLAKRLLIMPMHVFMKLGEKVGKPKAQIIFIFMTSRCGSSLVTQVFEETGLCITYSEPDAIGSISHLKGVVSDKERIQMATCCINLLCKPIQNRKIKSYVLKLTKPKLTEMPKIIELFLDVCILFIYRDGLQCSKSLAQMSKELPLARLMTVLGKWSATLSKSCAKAMGFSSENYGIKIRSGIQLGAIIWCNTIKEYLNFKECGMKIAAIRYEDLVDDTTYAFQKMFEYCGLTYHSKAVEIAMGRDSQRGTLLSRKNLKKYQEEEFSEEIQMQTNTICHQFGLPYFPEKLIVPGTVTHRNL